MNTKEATQTAHQAFGQEEGDGSNDGTNDSAWDDDIPERGRVNRLTSRPKDMGLDSLDIFGSEHSGDITGDSLRRVGSSRRACR